jgi:uncharacterized protein YndB with AHSA1/START domain
MEKILDGKSQAYDEGKDATLTISSIQSIVSKDGLTIMKTSGKSVFLRALVVIVFFYELTSGTEAAEKKPSATTAVVNTVTINGPPKAVFDLITTARLWPQWHPATKGVGGVVERPYGLGDLIHERGQIGDKEFQTTWKVVEHVRPSKIVLQSQTVPTRITYTFTAGKGTTAFTRRLEYKADSFAAVKELEKVMRDQSEQAIKQLKMLVEKLLSDEAKPLT